MSKIINLFFTTRGFIIMAALFFGFITVVNFAPTIFMHQVPLPTDVVNDYLLDTTPRTGENVWIRDVVVQIVPYNDFIFQEWRNGRIPAEHNYLFGTQTNIQATGQVDVWTPLNIFIPFFTSSLSFLAFKIIFYFFLCGFGMAAFLRGMRIHPVIALLGGVAFQWAGPMIAWQEWAVITGTWAWLPLVLLSVYKYIMVQPQKRWLALGVFSWWGMVSAGHVQFAAFAVGVAMLFTGVLLGVQYMERHTQKSTMSRWTWKNWGHVAIAITIAASITYFIIAPFLHASGASHRATISGVAAYQYANLIQFVTPNIWGTPNLFHAPSNGIESAAYIGFISLLLILIRVISLRSVKPRKQELFWAGLGIGMMALMLFPKILTPLYMIAPDFESYPLFRGLIVVSFSIIMLSMFAFQTILTHRTHVKQLWLSFTAAALLIIGGPLAVKILLPRQSAVDYYVYQLPIAVTLFACALIAVYFLVRTKKDVPLTSIRIIGLVKVLIFITLIDFAISWHGYNPQQSREPFDQPVEHVQFLQTLNKRPVVLYSEVSPLNQYMYYGFESLFGYDSNYPQATYKEYKKQGKVVSHRNILNVTFPADEKGVKFLRSKHVDYVITKNEWPLTLVHESDGIKVYSVPAAQ